MPQEFAQLMTVPDTAAPPPGSTHVVDVPLRWGDSDALNHLNNTLYFRLMEEARMQLLYGAGLSLPADAGPILAHASCDFLRPLTYPAEVRVTHTLTRVGRSSMEFELTLDKRGDPRGPYARGRNVLVWMDYQGNRAEPWPAHVLSALDGVMRRPG
ncbi:acyl-CoA thioesterase [Bordetella flabilis]